MSETVAVVQGMNEEQVRSVVYSVLQENKASRYEWPSSADLLERITKLDERVASLSERTVRVEEELKHQRELLYENQELVKIFMQQVDRRFEQVDKRFNMMQWFLGLGFTVLAVLMSLYNFVN